MVGEGMEYSLCGFLRLVAKAEIYNRDVGTIKLEEIRQVKTEVFRREWRRKKRSVYSKITYKIKVGSCHGETKQLLREVDKKIYFSGSEKFIITERHVQAQRAMG